MFKVEAENFITIEIESYAVLEDTEYEDRPWFYNAPKTSREGATVQQFYKKVSKSEGVYLMIEDWRNVV